MVKRCGSGVPLLPGEPGLGNVGITKETVNGVRAWECPDRTRVVRLVEKQSLPLVIAQ